MSPDAGASNKNITDYQAGEITRTEELAYDLKVRDVMSTQIRTLTPECSMTDLLELLRKEHISGVPVTCGNQLCGIVSLEDLIRALLASDLEAQIAKYMSTDLIKVKEFDAVVEALETFASSKVGRLPVVNQNGDLVGILTKGDITRGLLSALQKDYQAEEVRRYRASHLFSDIVSARTSLILRYPIKARDFVHGGDASSNIKRALLRLGANPQIARRCGIAIYEAEINLIIHTTSGGLIRVEIEPHRISMVAVDDGPGIENIDLAMTAGYSTADDYIREMGFGAGMGLVNIRRCVDKMSLESTPGKGTRLEMKIYLTKDESLMESDYLTGDNKT